jgi:uncharacterized protein
MHDDDFFWEGVKQGELLFQQCEDCGNLRQPPGPMCPQCQSLHWQPYAASGRGAVFAWIESRHPSELDEHPRIVALIELEEGIRFVSNLRDIALAQVREGMPVEVFFDTVKGTLLPQFRPARAGA